jgi:hypothetical protein
MMVVLETPKHVAFLIDINNKEFGCVRLNIVYHYICPVLFFLGGRRGMRTPKHLVNLMGESMVIFLSQTKSTPKHFFRKKTLYMPVTQI